VGRDSCTPPMHRPLTSVSLLQMQQDAKLWGERFDALKPPKAVDFLQAFLLELPDREGCPMFACERAIQGEYLKHNNNSGYVEPHRRATPQAFSHFTFQASGGRLIIVDIQGVGDLYTDPQVHSIEGGGYGEGNLGANGFALFFSAHRCSPLCARLGLTPFAKSPLEGVRGTVAAIAVDGNHAAAGEKGQPNAEAAPSPGAAALSIGSSTTTDNSTVMQRTWSSLDAALNRGHQSSGTGLDEDPHGLQAAFAESRSALHVGLDTEQARQAARRTWAARESARWHAVVPMDSLPSWVSESFNPPPAWLADMVPVPATAWLEALQHTSDDAQGWSPATEAGSELPVTPTSPKPALVLSLPEEDAWRMFAPVHLALARYCACGALPVLDGVPDEPSATYHAFCAARGGDITAVRAVRDICRGVVQDMVPGARLAVELPDLAAALTQALARGGDPRACLEAAESATLPKEQLTWLECAMAALDLAIVVDGQEADAAPPAAAIDIQRYDLLERIASARLAAGDRAGAAASFTEASEAAAALGKGKLSMKLAERASALEEEEE
jgi:hypothetical protein